jgi:hypothetical protein
MAPSSRHLPFCPRILTGFATRMSYLRFSPECRYSQTENPVLSFWRLAASPIISGLGGSVTTKNDLSQLCFMWHTSSSSR